MIVDLFAGGPAGWEHALKDLGAHDVTGIERDAAACQTRAACGWRTIRADVAAYRPPAAVELDGLCASPPCPTFSSAGLGYGRALLEMLCRSARDPAVRFDVAAAAQQLRVASIDDEFGEPGLTLEEAETVAREAALTLEPVRWALRYRPRWVACEQVPAVLPIWEATLAALGAAGYRGWCGILNAADYGVPQTRRRAVLLARLDGPVAPPEATHGRDPQPSLFGEVLPWVSMADALGPTIGRVATVVAPREADSPDGYRARDWRDSGEPSFAVGGKARSWVVQTGNNSMVTGREGSRAGDGDVMLYERSVDEPAPTLDAKVGGAWTINRPATTIQGDARVFSPGGHIAHDGRDNSKMVGRSENAIRITIEDALVLQSFPPSTPMRGSKTAQFTQVGNAIPPGLARAVLAQFFA